MTSVFVDARSTTANRLTGWERYASSLLEHLGNDDGVSWHYWTSKARKTGPAARVWQDFGELPRHRRGFSASFFPTYPPATKATHPTIWTLHDLTWLRYPQWASPMGKTYYKRLAAQRLSDSTHVVTVSDAIRNELLHEGLPERRVTRIYPGISKRLLEMSNTVSESGTERPFVLCVATAEPRKNLETLARAWAGSDLAGRYELVLVGRIGWGSLPAGITHHDRPSDEVLAQLYRNAAAFVMPSFYEGFGLPLIEAMQFGLPIACSDIPVFREVTGGLASFFPPTDEGALLRAVEEAVHMERYTAPDSLLSRYSWESSATQLATLVTRLVDGPG